MRSLNIVVAVLFVGSGTTNAARIDFLDLTDNLRVQIDGQFVGPPDVTFFPPETALTRLFQSANQNVAAGTIGVVLTEPGTGAVSDFIGADISGTTANGPRFTFFRFDSDPFNIPQGSLFLDLFNALVKLNLTIPETADPVNVTNSFRDALGNPRSLPTDLQVFVQSDTVEVPPELPEPSTYLLFTTGILGLLFYARTRNRAVRRCSL
jgi:hypothetical protein